MHTVFCVIHHDQSPSPILPPEPNCRKTVLPLTTTVFTPDDIKGNSARTKDWTKLFFIRKSNQTYSESNKMNESTLEP